MYETSETNQTDKLLKTGKVCRLGLVIRLYLLMRMNRINSKKKSTFFDQNIVILDSYFSFLTMDKTNWDEQ